MEQREFDVRRRSASPLWQPVLSYLHSFHAGNFADVHKHIALVILLRRLQEKDSPLCYIDSHAGRGIYDLQGEEARTTGEAEGGIRRLQAASDPPGPVRDYLELVASFNEGASTSVYPGSAALARAALRDRDRAILLELHPGEYPALKRFVGPDRRVAVHARDCYEGLPALVPPPIRRGLVLVDPSYEVKHEYRDVAELVCRVVERWATGIILLWYPLLAAGRHRYLLDRLAERALPRMLQSELQMESGAGRLLGSGLVVVNTPWRVDARLGDAMAFVCRALDPGRFDSHTLRWLTET